MALVRAEYKGALWHDVVRESCDSIADVVTPYSPELKYLSQLNRGGDPTKVVNLIVMLLCNERMFRLDLSIMPIAEAFEIIEQLELADHTTVDIGSHGRPVALTSGAINRKVVDSKPLCPTTYANLN